MPVYLNGGANPDAATYNGTALDAATYNRTTVWEKPAPPWPQAISQITVTYDTGDVCTFTGLALSSDNGNTAEYTCDASMSMPFSSGDFIGSYGQSGARYFFVSNALRYSVSGVPSGYVFREGVSARHYQRYSIYDATEDDWGVVTWQTQIVANGERVAGEDVLFAFYWPSGSDIGAHIYTRTNGFTWAGSGARVTLAKS